MQILHTGHRARPLDQMLRVAHSPQRFPSVGGLRKRARLTRLGSRAFGAGARQSQDERSEASSALRRA